MKAIITISLDTELIKKLKGESNYSDVINEQMKGYYDVKLIDNLEILNEKLVEIKQNLKFSRKKKRVIEESITKIEKKHKLFKKKLLSRSKMINEIEKRRALEKNSHRRTEYFITPAQEADILLKGGKI
ncbi:MAG: hypothetical protein GON13_03760 [Nanoarchaeota archaeon]|nr:hypothetical protein [Nanoarchaeota archaeon]